MTVEGRRAPPGPLPFSSSPTPLPSQRPQPLLPPFLPPMFSFFSRLSASSSTPPPSIPSSSELPPPSASTPSPPPFSSSSKKTIPVFLDPQEEKAFDSWREGLRHFTGMGQNEEEKALSSNRSEWGLCEKQKSDAFLWGQFFFPSGSLPSFPP